MAYQHKNGKAPPLKGNGSRLSSKMEAFVNEYLKDLNASQAVMRAGYQCKESNKNRIATELLHHPLVKQAIDERMGARTERLAISADYVINKLVDIAEAPDGKPVDILRSLELLGRHLGLYRDRQEISGPDGGAIEMEQRVTEDVNDFTRKLSRLAEHSGERVVPIIAKSSGGSKA